MLFLTLSFLFILSILNQEFSLEFMKLTIETTVVILWMIIPTITSILSFSIVVFFKKKFTFLVYVMTTLLLISNITFLIFLNIFQMGIQVIFIAPAVWGATFLFVVIILQEPRVYLVKVKILKSILVSATVTFILLQIYLLGNSIEVYKAVKVLNTQEKAGYSLFYFYRPLVSEIRLSNGKRWSYSRVKFVEDGR